MSFVERHFGACLAWLLVLALALRLAGISFGLPHIYHQDEPVIVNHAMAIGERGWNPRFFIIPPLTIYGSFLMYVFLYGALMLGGVVADKTSFAVLFLQDPTIFYLLARIIFGALFGCATVWVLAKEGAKRFGKETGCIAAFYLAISLLPTQHSHYIYADIPLTFFTTLLFFKVLGCLEQDRLKNFLHCGVWLGLATATKYTAAYFALPILLVYTIRYGSNIFRLKNLVKLTAAAFISVAVFLVLAPFTLLDFPNFWNQMIHQSGSEDYQGLGHHLMHSILNGTSLPFLVLSVAGVGVLWRRDRMAGQTLFLFLTCFYLINSFFGQSFSRYMMPLIPLLCLSAAYGWAAGGRRIKSGFLRTLLFIGIALSLLVPTVYADFLFLRRDTRDLCLSWVYQNIRPASVIIVDNRYHAPHLMQTIGQIREKAAYAEESADPAKIKRLALMEKAIGNTPTFQLYTLLREPSEEKGAYLFQRPFVLMDWEAFKKINADYLIVNYSEYHREIVEFKERMGARLELVVSFSPFWNAGQKTMLDVHSGTSAPDSQADLFSRRRLGPYLEVYKIRK